MKAITKLLALLVLVSFTTTLSAQSKRKKSKKDPVIERLWFGTGLDGVGITGNSFGVGLSPIVGYKLTPNFSTGVRVPFNYTYIKLIDDLGQGKAYNEVDLGVGAFARYHIFRGVFAHTEFNQLYLKDPVIRGNSFVLDPENPDNFLIEKTTRQEFNLGLGYSSGGNGGLGYEFGVLYNVIEPETSTRIPFTIRAGLNYNF